MYLPAALQQALDQAYTAVIHHPQHALLPIYRQRIYRTLDPSSDLRAERIRAELAIMTAKHVLPVWYEVRAPNNSPDRLLSMAQGVLNGTVGIMLAEREAEQAWNEVEEIGAGGEGPENLVPEYPIGVLAASVEALFEALGIHRFDTIVITEDDTDADIDPWSSDTAKWASIVYAGAVWDPDSDPVRRREFWEWWLKAAVPAAWCAVP